MFMLPGFPTGDFHGDPTNGCTSTGGVEAEIVDGQILSIDFDTLIGSGFEVDELDDDLGRLSAVPKKRTSRTKKRIRKNVWKRKASSAALKALSLAKSIYTGKSKSFLSNKLKNE
ncbi:50S RIBOSOMAL PROTEIN L32 CHLOROPLASTIC [Salix purpurea]|uniref:Large ribosomal subunit protein bL32c n=1 Tax=Salix purpurea TaxID=77065 RepID=A0A9Q0W6J9_SALPP|nr:50S RIBOSOMAL PROTEIN L32 CHLOROPLASTIC [Salix purpurea]